MQSDPRYFSGKDSPIHARGYNGHGNTASGGLGTYGTLVAPPLHDALAGRNIDFPSQLDGVEFQPSEICPKNFVIFDQTQNKSRIMYHPMLAHNFGSRGFDIHATRIQDGFQGFNNRYNDNRENFSSSLREDTADIDALLCSDDEEDNDDDEEEDDDVVSTGRTPGGGIPCSSTYSCSAEKSKRRSASVEKSFSSTASSSEKKRSSMRKMVKALRGIIPGGEQMDTPAVIDEAVRYLKSLKVEVKKLGIENIEE